MKTFAKTDMRKVMGGHVEKELTRDALTLLVKAGFAKGETTEAKDAQFSVPALIDAAIANEESLPKFAKRADDIDPRRPPV